MSVFTATEAMNMSISTNFTFLGHFAAPSSIQHPCLYIFWVVYYNKHVILLEADTKARYKFNNVYTMLFIQIVTLNYA